VMRSLQKVASNSGILLDDCAEYSFLWGPEEFRRPRKEPWVAIVHFPHNIDSPYPLDLDNNSSFTLLNNQAFQDSLPSMVGGIALCETLAAWWREQTGKPFIALKHPTNTDVPQWGKDRFMQYPRMIQLGHHVRNTQAIYHQPPISGWQYARIACRSGYDADRDRYLRMVIGRGCNDRVETWDRLPDDEYDQVMASSVILSLAYGVAACNVIVESIARRAPIIVERRPETEEYLGKDYCLYAGEHELDCPTILKAHKQLRDRIGPWIGCDYFAGKVVEFCDRILRSPS
jgi:hypothetical protein